MLIAVHNGEPTASEILSQVLLRGKVPESVSSSDILLLMPFTLSRDRRRSRFMIFQKGLHINRLTVNLNDNSFKTKHVSASPLPSSLA